MDLILGTAGHIDHGKTALIRALTGVDTDRLPEEKKRGITIDLGFAELTLGEHRLGVVDVPGHERFVRNMLAGATGMDVVMLVVAADDSVKPQTREHLDILRLLDLPEGVIALTKCDLAEQDWLALVEEEVREAVSQTFLRSAPIVRTSAVTGEGMDDLRAALSSAADRAAGKRPLDETAPFRMAIDRVFTIAGHGAVVTGSVTGGRAKLGDTLRIEPRGSDVRVRGLQCHDRAVEEVHRGQRAAINLAGVHHDEIDRGEELASVGFLSPARVLTVRLSLSPDAPRPLKDRTRARLHVGTAEILCSVRLLETATATQLAPGETAFAQLFLSSHAVTTWNQPFVLRSESPVATIGGGRVLDPSAQRIRKAAEADVSHLNALASSDATARAAAAAYFSDLRDWRPADWRRTAGLDGVEAVYRSLVEQGEIVEIAVSPTRFARLHRQAIDRLARRICSWLEKAHDQDPLRPFVDRSRLAAAFTWVGDAAVLNAVLDRMSGAGEISLTDRGAALAGRGPKLSAGEQKLLAEIIEWHLAAGVEPPTVADCKNRATKNRDSTARLIELAAAQGDLEKIADDMHLHAEVLAEIKRTLTESITQTGGMTLSQIRERLGTSRKYAIPICEYLDRTRFTRRNGDLRMLAK